MPAAQGGEMNLTLEDIGPDANGAPMFKMNGKIFRYFGRDAGRRKRIWMAEDKTAKLIFSRDASTFEYVTVEQGVNQ
jgi:hypothetical protein